MTEHISPCPFCGHQPEDMRDFLHTTGQGWRDDNGMRHYMRYNDPRGCHGRVWKLGCLEHEGGCGATMHGDSREDVIAKWNHRPGAARPSEHEHEHDGCLDCLRKELSTSRTANP